MIKGLLSLFIVLSGASYIWTLDGLSYDLELAGEFDLTYDDKLRVQIRYIPVKGSNISISSAILIKYNDHRIMISKGHGDKLPDLYINSYEPREYSTGDRIGLYDGDQIGYLFIKGNLDTLLDPLAFHLVYTSTIHSVDVIFRKSKFDVQYMTAVITYPNDSENNISGLLGNYDGEKDNDLMMKNGTIFSPDGITFQQKYYLFGNSYRLNKFDSYFYYKSGESISTFQNISFPSGPVKWSQSDEINAQNICFSKKSTDMINSCIYNVLVTGDETFAIEIWELITITDWSANETFTNKTEFLPMSTPSVPVNKTKNRGAAIGLGILLIFAIIVLIILAIYFYLRYREKLKRKEAERVRGEV